MRLFLREDFANAWAGREPFACVQALDGEVFRAREGRRTLRFEMGGREYFLKHHRGIGWREILKNLSQLKSPVLGAGQEFEAVNRLQEQGVDTLTVGAFGERGLNPAARESFIITDALVDTLSLEDVFERELLDKTQPRFRRRLVRRVGDIARRMHGAGVNHRDFYLCHFLMDRKAVQAHDGEAKIHLIDLHRSQVRRNVPERWRVKDLGGLYFSVARARLSRADLFRFIETYAGVPWREELSRHGDFWVRVQQEGERIYRRYYEQEPAFPLQFAEHPGKDI